MEYLQRILNAGIDYAPKIILALLTLIVGLWIIGKISKALQAQFAKSNLDASLKPFLGSLVSVLLKVMLLLSVASIIGIETTSFVALVGAAGFAVGLALQGSLSNFAGGVLILVFKPYKVGDYISAQGFTGTVAEIQIFTTIIKTDDNKVVSIPNGPLAAGSMVNIDAEPIRRTDFVFPVSGANEIQRVRGIIKGILDSNPKVLKEPAADIFVELGDGFIKFVVRVWSETTDYRPLYYEMHEAVKVTFEKENVIPAVPTHITINK
jgi:small conductance mechanosensitive channel